MEGSPAKLNIIEEKGDREQSIIKNKSCIHEHEYIFCCGMFHVPEILADSPDIHDQADKCPHADNDNYLNRN